jgi:hypothetical protein
VIAAIEHNTVYVSAADGHILWSVSLGKPVPGSELPCGAIYPLGIISSAPHDQATRLIFVVADTQGGRHNLASVDLAGLCRDTARVLPPPKGDEIAHQQRAVGNRQAIRPLRQLRGPVVAAPTTSTCPLRSYMAPAPAGRDLAAPAELPSAAVGGCTWWVTAGRPRTTTTATRCWRLRRS